MPLKVLAESASKVAPHAQRARNCDDVGGSGPAWRTFQTVDEARVKTLGQ
jgi:hypothetical protein